MAVGASLEMGSPRVEAADDTVTLLRNDGTSSNTNTKTKKVALIAWAYFVVIFGLTITWPIIGIACNYNDCSKRVHVIGGVVSIIGLALSGTTYICCKYLN